MAWHFGEGVKYCKNCQRKCQSCPYDNQPQTLDGMLAWEIIQQVYHPQMEKFPLIEALELAKIKGMDLELAVEYFYII